LVKQTLLVTKTAFLSILRVPTITSGIRLGTQACTTRGFGGKEFKLIGDLISKVLNGLAKNSQR
jgi:glycine/serine hydroxymethyltransferase